MNTTEYRQPTHREELERELVHGASSQIVPSVILVAAKAFAHRLMKRRPTVQPSSWRMCSST